MKRNVDETITFMVSHSPVTDCHVLILGIPKKAWENMQGGISIDFDLRGAGIPIQLALFGADDHTGVMKIIEDVAKQSGIAILDERRKDFAIKGNVR
jgi:hypothetical protein